ncbi:hypothetical protein [Moorena sp. SIO4G3]|nr:hypothetical protein [Moorena sp. SIO4G3]
MGRWGNGEMGRWERFLLRAPNKDSKINKQKYLSYQDHIQRCA